ncbi:MAG TPA: acyltransferase [Gaiellaceae bacterium]|jgi:acetyltransferase-like isoleucine patch superfamily enzyme|nr:acyltransferase [Gaiellaceae bacterium]
MLAEVVDWTVRRFHRAWHRRVAASFAAFGAGSSIAPPLDALTEPGRIEIGNGTTIRAHARLEVVQREDGAEYGRVRIGDDVQVEGYFSVSAAASVTIGNSVLIGSNVAIRDHDHGIAPDRHRAKQGLVAEPVEIGDFAWLGQNVVVLKGVAVGRNAVVGANAVVTRSVPDGAVVAGVPARQIGWIDGSPFEG